MRTAVILAGGTGRRFREGGRHDDKLLLRIDGEILLRRVARTALEAVDELILTVDSQERGERYLGLTSSLGPVRMAVDAPVGMRLPMAGVVSGLSASNSNYVLILPGDACCVTATHLEALLSVVEAGEADCCAPICDGSVQTLFQALEGERARRTAPVLMRLDWRKPDGFLRGATRSAYLSFEAQAFFTMNTPQDAVKCAEDGAKGDDQITAALSEGLDLAELPRHSEAEVEDLTNRLMERRSFFWAGAISMVRGPGLALLSSKAFSKEGELYEGLGISLLAAHARADAARALRRAGVEH